MDKLKDLMEEAAVKMAERLSNSEEPMSNEEFVAAFKALSTYYTSSRKFLSKPQHIDEENGFDAIRRRIEDQGSDPRKPPS